MVGQVVEGDDGGRTADDRVVPVEPVAQDDGRRAVPVVDVDDVDGAAVGPERLEGGPGEEPEPPAVVGVVTLVGIAVEPGPVEGRRMVHQPEPVAVAHDVDDRDLGRAERRERVGDPDPTSGMLAVGQGHRPIAGQEDVDRRGRAVRDPPERPGQGVDDVAQPARLGPRFALGGDEGDAHLPDGSGRGASRNGPKPVHKARPARL